MDRRNFLKAGLFSGAAAVKEPDRKAEPIFCFYDSSAGRIITDRTYTRGDAVDEDFFDIEEEGILKLRTNAILATGEQAALAKLDELVLTKHLFNRDLCAHYRKYSGGDNLEAAREHCHLEMLHLTLINNNTYYYVLYGSD
jgi:hypothetical protein